MEMLPCEDWKKCIGCEACVQICPKECFEIKIKNNFYYPELINQEQCIHCGLCEKVCPVNASNTKEKNIAAYYGAINHDENIVNNSSSGGVFTALAKAVLLNDGVVFGAVLSEDLSVRHIYINKIEDISLLQKSKYVQSRIGDTYKQVKQWLSNEKTVLFSGTPCQIAGLRSFLKREYKNLICVDIVCHGIPSPFIWSQYTREFKKKIKYVNFREKSDGWKKFFMHFLFENSDEYKEYASKDKYMHLFLSDYILRESCYDCKFKGKNSCADITLGDFWGIESLDPSFYNDKGVSLVIVRSAIGTQLFEQIADELSVKQYSEQVVLQTQTAISKSARRPEMREWVWQLLDAYSVHDAAAISRGEKLSFQKRLRYFLKKKKITP